MRTLSEAGNEFFDLFGPADLSPAETAESDKLCFRNALKQFLASGKKEDAFCVYFCFSEIFKLFGQGYENTKKLLEMLSDHEYHSGELLSKHRDHYSHSVYVFALGLALYAGDGAYRRAYLRFYGLEENGASAVRFLKYWGLASLFHDIGYPFQLAHEQIKAYAEEVWGGGAENNLYVSYGNLEEFIGLGEGARRQLAAAFPAAKPFSTYHDLFAYGLAVREGYDPAAVCAKLTERIVRQPEFMDHGYFSALILARQLFAGGETAFGMEELDVLTAILLHNSFNKFDAPGRHPIGREEHPLSYLLILCDELQCWDRLAYGKVSRRDPVAWDFGLEIGEDSLAVRYVYDCYTVRPDGGAGALNKNYAEMKEGAFVRNLQSYIRSPLRLTVETEERKKQKKTSLYASDDNFISLCDMAKAIHSSYNDHCKSFGADFISEDFGNLDLEFKLSNIEQAKSYAYKLELINCFYSRKELDYPVVEDFGRVETDYKDNLEFLSREEHVRWVREKLAMGWRYGADYTSKEERNRKKHHKDIVPYEQLPEEERAKDRLMINNIIVLLNKLGGNVKIYNYRSGKKPTLQIAGTGHRYFDCGEAGLKARVKEILEGFAQTYHVIVRTCFARGADQLIAECAAELGLTLKADLPMPVEEFIANVRRDGEENGVPFTAEDELRMRHLLAQTAVCRVIRDERSVYAAASAYIVQKCDKVIALWDGKELPLEDGQGNPVNRGGTYDCICMAQRRGLEMGKDIIIVHCDRKGGKKCH